jgi:hypothetical protein
MTATALIVVALAVGVAALYFVFVRKPNDSE